MKDLNTFEIVLIILGGLYVLVIAAYIIAFKTAIFISRFVKRPVAAEADQYYYLPRAYMKLTATAKVQVEQSIEDKSIIGSPKLLELRFTPAVQFRPDPEAMIALSYKGNWFSNDEIQIVSADAMLENIKAVTEDRLSSIVAQITQAPAQQAAVGFAAKRAITLTAAIKTQTVIIEATREFSIDSEEIESGTIDRIWQIPLEGIHTGTTIRADASFKLTTIQVLASTDWGNLTVEGLFTRPLVAQEWKLDNANTDNAAFVCMVPDTGSLIKVPVRRSYFVKKQQLPIFRQGILIENSISKPSEAEGLISIPINLLKALMTIPAQLLQFKITRVTQETEHEKALAELAKAKAGNTQSPPDNNNIKRLEEELDALKKSVQSQLVAGSETDDTDDTEEQDPVPQLGKLPPLKFEEDEEDTRKRRSFNIDFPTV
ncbi:MAG: hypothetical protein J7621_13090, partial [Niastella sp.]|nr:hypothetical protein [Niastella sp.]